ncbi:uncharacterized protein YeaO (DUF488 family) [Acidovorax sp. 100]|uniref:DUF488 domain-containing protein n=1 Tax=Acidovorax sp. 100 TaxID=2135635 RepID=UPI000EFA0F62|nr:DUF488 family protein [Acidovorax sp. 100]RMA62255.1 uncharacterized protein YeaO (DUF488 family) [Acidovorax sp. 100]
MPLRIVRLGTPRAAGEGTRIGTVRRPPRGVPKAEFASRDYYDVWYPLLSPSADLMAQGQQVPSGQEGDKAWETFAKQFRKELAQPEASRTLDLLAALSHHSALSLGCYCEDEARCHRSVLRAELAGRGADITN